MNETIIINGHPCTAKGRLHIYAHESIATSSRWERKSNRPQSGRLSNTLWNHTRKDKANDMKSTHRSPRKPPFSWANAEAIRSADEKTPTKPQDV